MKKVVLSVLLFFALNTSAQIGVLTLGEKELPYYGQWYTVDAKDYKNQVLFFDKIDIVDSLITELLKPWELELEDGEKDEDGDLYWLVDNGNGFNSSIYLVDLEDGDAQIIIVTSEIEN